jgi:type I restriction-modification system DNA methylase subunit
MVKSETKAGSPSHASNFTLHYSDIAGFCYSATKDEIAKHGYVLTPGRYVGAEAVEDDGDPFEEKMPRLISELEAQFKESAKLEAAIRANLKGLGFGSPRKNTIASKPRSETALHTLLQGARWEPLRKAKT